MISINDRQAEVLAGIRAGRMQQEIAEGLKLSKQQISRLTRGLIDLGLVIEPRRARFQVTDEPHRYMKRPVAIDAIRLTTDDSATAIVDWATSEGHTIGRIFAEGDPEVLGLMVPTLKGPERAEVGDWVVLTREHNMARGEFDVVKPDAFAAQMQAVSDGGN